MTDRSEDIETRIRPARRREKWILGMAVLALLAAGATTLPAWKDDTGLSFVTQVVDRGDIVTEVVATGTVQPRSQVEISSELSGTLEQVLVDFNDRVEAGQVLARLDDDKVQAQLKNAEASLVAAEARLEQARASLFEAEANYQTEKALDERGVSTQSTLVAREAAWRRAAAALTAAKADLELAQANLELQRTETEKTEIRSPIGGMVLDRAAEPGQTVAASLSAPVLFLLAEDLARMELQVDIDEADIGQVSVGDPADFEVDAYPDRSFPAEISQLRFAPETTDGIVTYKAVLSVDNDDFLLRPGMTALARIRVDEAEGVLRVPNAALRFTPESAAPAADISASRESGKGLVGLVMPARPGRSGGARAASSAAGEAVWMEGPGGLRKVEVETGRTDGHYTEILAGDIREGDRVITDQRAGASR